MFGNNKLFPHTFLSIKRNYERKRCVGSSLYLRHKFTVRDLRRRRLLRMRNRERSQGEARVRTAKLEKFRLLISALLTPTPIMNLLSASLFFYLYLNLYAIPEVGRNPLLINYVYFQSTDSERVDQKLPSHSPQVCVINQYFQFFHIVTYASWCSIE